MTKRNEPARREPFANRPEGRIRRDGRRQAIQGKRVFAFMGSV